MVRAYGCLHVYDSNLRLIFLFNGPRPVCGPNRRSLRATSSLNSDTTAAAAPMAAFPDATSLQPLRQVGSTEIKTPK